MAERESDNITMRHLCELHFLNTLLKPWTKARPSNTLMGSLRFHRPLETTSHWPFTTDKGTAGTEVEVADKGITCTSLGSISCGGAVGAWLLRYSSLLEGEGGPEGLGIALEVDSSRTGAELRGRMGQRRRA